MPSHSRSPSVSPVGSISRASVSRHSDRNSYKEKGNHRRPRSRSPSRHRKRRSRSPLSEPESDDRNSRSKNRREKRKRSQRATSSSSRSRSSSPNQRHKSKKHRRRTEHGQHRHHHHHGRREDKDKESELEPESTDKSTQDMLAQIVKAAADLARNTSLTAQQQKQQQKQQQVLPPKGRRAPMVPQKKEDYDKEQSVIREVLDPLSGRTRLVKGSGEIIERIVTQDQHRAINQLATRGDGASYQAGLTQRLARR